MEIKELFKEENKNILFTVSWLLKNLDFDRSIGTFKDTDLFTFLDNIQKFDYSEKSLYDDFYFILEYTQDPIVHIIRNINSNIVKTHEMLSLSQAKEYDRTTLSWLGRQSGRTIKEKIKNNKIKAVKRVYFFDTPENRLFKKFLKILLTVHELREDLQENQQFSKLFREIRLWLKSEVAKSIDEKKHISYNNVLLHHKYYHKILKSYRWYQNIEAKIEEYKTIYPKQLYRILYFEILTQLQFFTNKPILPSDINFDLHKFDFEYKYDKNILANDIDINSVTLDGQDLLEFSSIRKLATSIIKNQFQVQLNHDRRFIQLDLEDEDVYIDLFKLKPEVLADNKLFSLPLLLKTKIGEKLINATNTKVIDLDLPILSMLKTLQTYNSAELSSFLEDIKKILPEEKLYYLIPDYINSFDFSKLKQSINSYFKVKSIPKSIAIGMEYIFKGKIKENDVIFVQQRFDNDLYITPLLIKYDALLEGFTNGLYVERHPTKLVSHNEGFLVNLENEYGSRGSKFIDSIVYNDFQVLQDNNVKILDEGRLFSLSNVEIKNTIVTLDEIKGQYDKKVLFNGNYYVVEETQTILNTYKNIVEIEKTGLSLWKEHLPELAMEIMKNGYYDKFILVNDESEIVNKKIKIQEHFIIPKNEDELSFPLILDNENINYRATLDSKEFPFDDDVECKLELTYDYEQENPYQLIFLPLDENINPIHVEWISSIVRDDLKPLPIPEYPPKKTWKDFTKDPKRDGSGYSDLLEWIIERLALLDINKIPKYLIDREHTRDKSKFVEGSFEWGGYDKNQRYYCRINVDGESLFCHSSNFIEEYNQNHLHEGQKIYLSVEEKRGDKIGTNIYFSEKYIENLERKLIDKIEEDYKNKPLEEKFENIRRAIRSLRYPLIRVWNGHSLKDEDVPVWFRDQMLEYINMALVLIQGKNVSDQLKRELLLVFSTLHSDMPIKISNVLVQFSKSLKENERLANNFASSIGDGKLKWQEEILGNILDNLGDNTELNNTVFNILAIAFWRSEVLIYTLTSERINQIEQKLVESFRSNFNDIINESSKFSIKSLVRNLELLLALLRLRKVKYFLAPNEKLTLKYLKVIDEVTKYFVENQINIKTRISLELDKPEEFEKVNDLLFALRVYLAGDLGFANKIKIIGISDE